MGYSPFKRKNMLITILTFLFWFTVIGICIGLVFELSVNLFGFVIDTIQKIICFLNRKQSY